MDLKNVATAVLTALLACSVPAKAQMQECTHTPGISGYINKSGACVPRPRSDEILPDITTPTAICANGKYSYSKTRSGTCSRNGGVHRWL